MPFGNYTSKIHAQITGGRQNTLIEDLAFETFESGDTANDIILEFLREDSIIERTEDCWTYFTQHVIPVAATLNVIYYFWMQSQNGFYYTHQPVFTIFQI